jgi:hypothetical protein
LHEGIQVGVTEPLQICKHGTILVPVRSFILGKIWVTQTQGPTGEMEMPSKSVEELICNKLLPWGVPWLCRL